MRVRAQTQIEVPITRRVASGDDVEEGTRLVDVEVEADVLYDEVRDDCGLTGHVVTNPHGWTWGDLDDETRDDLESMLCAERHAKDRARDSAMADLSKRRRQLTNAAMWSPPDQLLMALGELFAAVDRALAAHGDTMVRS